MGDDTAFEEDGGRDRSQVPNRYSKMERSTLKMICELRLAVYYKNVRLTTALIYAYAVLYDTWG